jgi:lysylphosphatidylglycerol synthetase-like protein (DUF2156 family)
VRRWGTGTLAPFALRPDKEWFITGQTVIACRVIRHIALISGDPVGPPAQTPAAVATFLAHAQAHGWRTAILGPPSGLLPAYRELGLHPVYHGDEAVIDTRAFSLAGRRMRTARLAVHRLQRRGFRAEVLTAGQVPPGLRRAGSGGARVAARRGPARASPWNSTTCCRLGGDDAMFVIGRDQQHRVNGFLHLAACPASGSLSLSAMPRQPGTPNGFTAWLIAEAVSWARAHRYTYVSLNFAPFAGLLARQRELPRVQRLQRRALLRLKRLLALQLDNLLRFNNQFDPAWQPRYVILQAWADLPRIVLAAMAAEGYLPRARLIRGRAWAPPPPRPRPGQQATAAWPRSPWYKPPRPAASRCWPGSPGQAAGTCPHRTRQRSPYRPAA